MSLQLTDEQKESLKSELKFYTVFSSNFPLQTTNDSTTVVLAVHRELGFKLELDFHKSIIKNKELATILFTQFLNNI